MNSQFDTSKFVDPDSIQSSGESRQTRQSQAGPVEQTTSKFDATKFVDPDAAPPQTASNRPKGVLPPQSDVLMPVITGFKRGVEDVVEGITQTTAQGLGAIGVPTEAFQKNLATQRQEREADYETTKAEHPILTRLGYVGGNVGVYAGVPMSKAGIFARTGIGALIGSTGYQEAPSLSGRLAGAAFGGVVGAVAPPLLTLGTKGIAATGRALKNYFSKTPTDAMIQKVLQPIENDPEALRHMKIASEKGTFLTPAEASGSIVTKGAEERLTPSPQAALELEQKLVTRQGTLRTQARDIIRGLLPEGETPKTISTKIDTLYKSVDATPMPQEVSAKLLQNPRILAVRNSIASDPLKSFNDYPTNSMGRFRQIKIGLDNEITKDPTNQALKVARAEIQDALKTNPEYVQANKLAQQRIIYNDYMDKLNSIGIRKGEDEPIEQQLYSKLFGSTEKQVQFLKDIKTTGGDTKAASSFLKILNHIDTSGWNHVLRGSTTPFAKGTFTNSLRGMGIARIRQIVMGQYDDKVVEIITNPGKYLERLKAIENSPKADQPILLRDLFTSISIHGATSD